jgi:cytochrome bd-type quinol oxidase subunit 2
MGIGIFCPIFMTLCTGILFALFYYAVDLSILTMKTEAFRARSAKSKIYFAVCILVLLCMFISSVVMISSLNESWQRLGGAFSSGEVLIATFIVSSIIAIILKRKK